MSEVDLPEGTLASSMTASMTASAAIISGHMLPAPQVPKSSAPGKLGLAMLPWGLIEMIASLPAAWYPLGPLLYALRRLWGRRNWRQMQRNIAMIWGLPPQSSFAQTFARQVARHQIQTGLETIKAILRPQGLRLEGFDALAATMQEQEAAGLGQVVITAHLGSWELVGSLCARASKRRFYGLAKPNRLNLVTRLLERLRLKMGIGVLWTGSSSLGRQMLGILKEGDWLGFVMDQKPLGRKGPVVPFFGFDTEFVAGPAAMVVKTGRPVVAVFCVRLAPMHFRLLHKVLLPAHHGEHDRLTVTRLMAAEIEAAIRLYPEQWCWDYRRWRFPS